MPHTRIPVESFHILKILTIHMIYLVSIQKSKISEWGIQLSALSNQPNLLLSWIFY
jgi:hypothetical protein